MTLNRRKRPVFKTERIEVRCSPTNKNRIYALADVLELSVSELMIRGIQPMLDNMADQIQERIEQAQKEQAYMESRAND